MFANIPVPMEIDRGILKISQQIADQGADINRKIGFKVKKKRNERHPAL